MNFLTEIANQLDARGLYTEANEIDALIKTSVPAGPKYTPEEAKVEIDKIMNRPQYNFDLELAKTENTLLRLYSEFENIKREDLFDFLKYSGLLGKIRKYLALLPKQIYTLREKVLSGTTKEDRVKLLDEIKKVEANEIHWKDKISQIEKQMSRY